MAVLPHKPRLIVGVDTGGTFTDFIVWQVNAEADNPGHIFAHKVLSTPDDPSRAVLQGLQHVVQRFHTAPQLSIVHGSTVATNALLERRGMKTAFITTQGFEDMLTIGRQHRAELYNLQPKPRASLVPPALQFGAAERVASTGQVLQSLQQDDIERLVQRIKQSGASSVAICLVFSFLHPQHEQRLATALRQAGMHVSASHEVLPEYREYERAATTVINAYISPIMKRYLHQLSTKLAEQNVRSFRVMQSNGGSISPQVAGEHGVHTILSGPAGGVVGAFGMAQHAGMEHIISFDMGGTSTDVCIVPGKLQTTVETEIDGWPVRVPILDIHTVGAGGGSIATVDEGGALRVGPQSAGAQPGPACYGFGGTLPTVTDAHVVLGRLPTDGLVDGSLPLQHNAAERALHPLADTLNTTVSQAAAGIIDVANVQMERAIRVISLEKGYDPEDFVLVSYGGAGGLHAADIARHIGIPRVLLPRYGGVLSAWGMAAADVVKTSSKGLIGPLDELLPTAHDALRQLLAKAHADLRQELRHGAVQYVPAFDLRYEGQAFELTVPLPAVHGGLDSRQPPELFDITTENIVSDFHAQHMQRYTHRLDEPIELVAVRLRAQCNTTARVGPPVHSASAAQHATDEPIRIQRVFINNAWHGVPVFRWNNLPRHFQHDGAAIFVEAHTTVLSGLRDRITHDEYGNLHITVNAHS